MNGLPSPLGGNDLIITPTLILPHQGGGKFFRELDAPQLCCGVLHLRNAGHWNDRNWDFGILHSAIRILQSKLYFPHPGKG